MIAELQPFESLLSEPVVTGHGLVRVRKGFVVRLDGGGVGEATPLEAFGTESLERCEAALRGWRFDGPLEAIADVEQALTGVTGTPAARHALELALLVRLAVRKKVPLAALMSDTPARTVTSAALVNGASAATLAARAEEAVRAGFRTLKVKVATQPLHVEAQRLLAIRRAVGPSVKIRVDANGAWSEGSARTALRAWESLELELCEQPVAATDLEGMSRLRGYVPGAIALDEALLGPELPSRVFDLERPKVADVAVLKPMALGGVLQALGAARRFAALGVPAYVTTLLDGPVARAGAVHLAAALPSSGFAHGLATPELFEGAEADAYTPVGGDIRLPVQPGLGLG